MTVNFSLNIPICSKKFVFILKLFLIKASKVVAKNELKYLPILGWSWYFSEYVFVKRKWESDQKVLAKDINQITQYPNGYFYSVIFFWLLKV
jgi:1-acyl-sn-glycerol-3-phosphate acyltransferase